MASPAADRDGYVFKRNADATSRLNYQYYLWQDTLRFHLHPGIPPLQPNARIADVATGSGIWLYDLSRQVPPTTSLTGLDISMAQIPNPTLLPCATFNEWSFFTPPPPELYNSFDVVHMRLIAVAIKDGDAGRVLENVKLILKPGGYLQWEEHYTPEAHVLTADGQKTHEFEGLNGMRDLLSSPLESTDGQLLLGPRDWLKTLESTLQAHGFDKVRKLVYLDAAHMGRFWNEIYTSSAEEFSAQMLERDPVLAHALRDIIDKMNKEKPSGAWVSNPKAVFLGQWRGGSGIKGQ